jgi:hypothetical protein
MLPQHNIFYGDHGLSQGSHVTTIAFSMLFQLDNHHLSLQDRSFISPVSHTYSNHEMLSSIPIYNFFQICHPQISKFHIFIFRFVPHRNQIHKYEIFLLITVWLNRHWSSLWAYLCFHIQDPSSCNSIFT